MKVYTPDASARIFLKSSYSTTPPAVATFSDRFVPAHRDADASIATLHEIRRQSLNFVSEDNQNREAGLPVEQVDSVLNRLDRRGLPARAPPFGDDCLRLGSCPRHALLCAERGLRDLLRRRRTRKAGEVEARQPHSVGGSKERADVVEAAHVVQKNFYDGPGPS